MTVTTATLISETERHLLAGDRDQLNKLAGAIDASQTNLVFTYDLQGIQPGAYIDIDLETMYVWDIGETGRTATVERAMLGTTASTHADLSLTYVNAKFSKASILQAINMELRDLPPDGLYQIKSFTLTTQPVQKTYTIPAENNDLIDIAEIRWIEPGAEKRWPRVWRRDYQIVRDMPTTGDGGFSSGLGLRIEPALYPGRTMSVRYTAPFTELSALNEVVTSTTGLPAGALDIPPLGAAARLMGVRESKRAFAEAAVDSRRAGEVPPGSASRAAQMLMALLRQRIQSEHANLLALYPDLR